MCVPIVEPDVKLSDEDLKRIQDAASAGGTTTGATTTPATTTPADTSTATTASGGRTIPGKATGGTVTEQGNTESGGLTPAELLNQQLMGQIADLQGNANLINQQIANQATGFQSVAQGILDGQKLAADALKSGFLDLTEQQQKAMDAAEVLRKNTGQASRKPNYSLSLKANAQANRGGISSTLLTGATGVATNELTLGRPALLGS